MRAFTVYVRGTANSIAVLKYIKNNIKRIRAADAMIEVIKVKVGDRGMLDKLRASKINSLPALTRAGGEPIIGSEGIIDFFERNLSKSRQRGSAPSESYSARPSDDYHSYFLDEVFRGVQKTGGKLTVPQNERDLDDDEGESFKRTSDRRMRDMERMRGGRSEYNEDDDPGERPRVDLRSRGNDRTGGSGSTAPGSSQRGRAPAMQQPRNRRQPEYDDTGMDIDPNQPGESYSEVYNDDEIDRKMMEAWENNIGS